MEPLDSYNFFTPLTKDIIDEFYVQPSKCKLNTIYAVSITPLYGGNNIITYNYGIIVMKDDFIKCCIIDVNAVKNNTKKYFNKKKVCSENVILNNGFIDVDHISSTQYSDVNLYKMYMKRDEAGALEVLSNQTIPSFKKNKISSRIFSKKVNKLFGLKEKMLGEKSSTSATTKVLSDRYLSKLLSDNLLLTKTKTKKGGKYKKQNKSSKTKRR